MKRVEKIKTFCKKVVIKYLIFLLEGNVEIQSYSKINMNLIQFLIKFRTKQKWINKYLKIEKSN